MAFWFMNQISKAKDYAQKNIAPTLNEFLNPNEQQPRQNPFSQKKVEYIQEQSTEPTNSFFTILPKPPLPVSFQTQLHQYQKLCKIQQHILTKMKQEEMKGYQNDRNVLEGRLREVEEEKQREKTAGDRERIQKRIRDGEITLESIIEENLIMKEKLQEIRIGKEYQKGR